MAAHVRISSGAKDRLTKSTRHPEVRRKYPACIAFLGSSTLAVRVPVQAQCERVSVYQTSKAIYYCVLRLR